MLRSFDGEKVLVPCSQVLASPLTNYTMRGKRRTTLSVPVAYKTDLEHARRVLLEAVREVGGVLEPPEPEVWVDEFAESGVALAVRLWHAPDIATLWRVRSAVAIAVRSVLDRSAIEIPVPHRVLRFAGDVPARPARDGGGEHWSQRAKHIGSDGAASR